MASRKLPKVGDIIAISWIDSGIGVFKTDVSAELITLHKQVEYGKVLVVDNTNEDPYQRRVIFAQGHGLEDTSYNDVISGVWIPAIIEWRKARFSK